MSTFKFWIMILCCYISIILPSVYADITNTEYWLQARQQQGETTTTSSSSPDNSNITELKYVHENGRDDSGHTSAYNIIPIVITIVSCVIMGFFSIWCHLIRDLDPIRSRNIFLLHMTNFGYISMNIYFTLYFEFDLPPYTFPWPFFFCIGLILGPIGLSIIRLILKFYLVELQTMYAKINNRNTLSSLLKTSGDTSRMHVVRRLKMRKNGNPRDSNNITTTNNAQQNERDNAIWDKKMNKMYKSFLFKHSYIVDREWLYVGGALIIFVIFTVIGIMGTYQYLNQTVEQYLNGSYAVPWLFAGFVTAIIMGATFGLVGLIFLWRYNDNLGLRREYINFFLAMVVILAISGVYWVWTLIDTDMIRPWRGVFFSGLTVPAFFCTTFIPWVDTRCKWLWLDDDVPSNFFKRLRIAFSRSIKKYRDMEVTMTNIKVNNELEQSIQEKLIRFLDQNLNLDIQMRLEQLQKNGKQSRQQQRTNRITEEGQQSHVKKTYSTAIMKKKYTSSSNKNQSLQDIDVAKCNTDQQDIENQNFYIVPDFISVMNDPKILVHLLNFMKKRFAIKEITCLFQLDQVHQHMRVGEIYSMIESLDREEEDNVIRDKHKRGSGGRSFSKRKKTHKIEPFEEYFSSSSSGGEEEEEEEDSSERDGLSKRHQRVLDICVILGSHWNFQHIKRIVETYIDNKGANLLIDDFKNLRSHSNWEHRYIDLKPQFVHINAQYKKLRFVEKRLGKLGVSGFTQNSNSDGTSRAFYTQHSSGGGGGGSNHSSDIEMGDVEMKQQQKQSDSKRKHHHKFKRVETSHSFVDQDIQGSGDQVNVVDAGSKREKEISEIQRQLIILKVMILVAFDRLRGDLFYNLTLRYWSDFNKSMQRLFETRTTLTNLLNESSWSDDDSDEKDTTNTP